MATSWTATIWVNFLRTACAGLIIGIIMVSSDATRLPSWQFLIAAPLLEWLVALLLVTPMWLLTKITHLAFPFLWLMTGITISIGDPLVFIFHKVLPSVVPVEKYSFISFKPFITVYKDDVPARSKKEKVKPIPPKQGIYEKYTASEWNSLAHAIISGQLINLPSGELGLLGKAVIKKDLSSLPPGELGQLGRALINNSLTELPSGEIGQLGRAIMNNSTTELPSGKLGSIGRAIIKKDTTELP